VENPNAPGPDGWTPLQHAAQYGSTEIFKFFAPQVKNPNAPTPNGLTPLQIATNNNHTEIVEILSLKPKFLISAGFEIDLREIVIK